MKTYAATFRFQDRKQGPSGKTVKLDATSLAAAIARGTREFLSGLSRKERWDANRRGLRVECVRVLSQKAKAE